MPAYRTSLTIIAAGLTAVGTASAQGDNLDLAAMGGESGRQAGLVTVGQPSGLAPALRQSTRLTAIRYAPPPAVAETALPAETPGVKAVMVHEVASLPPISTIDATPVSPDKSVALGVAAAAAETPLVASAVASGEPPVSVFDAGASASPAGDGVLSRFFGLVRGRAAQSAGTGEAIVARSDSGAHPIEVPALSGLTDNGAAHGSAAQTLSADAAMLGEPSRSAPVTVAAPVGVTRIEASGSRPVVALSEIKLASAEPVSLPTLLGGVSAVPPSDTPMAWTLARDDRTVRTAIERWARQVQWQVAWELPTDFKVEFNADFDGDFIEAVAKVVDGLSAPERPVRAEFYKGNRVLRILSGRQ